MKAFSLRTLVVTLLLVLVTAALAQEANDNVAAGLEVTSSRIAGDNYPDGNGLKLTDGAYDFSWDDMVGFEGAEPIVLTVDLGKTYDEISSVALKAMRSDGSAASLPATFIVSISEDGLLYDDLGMGRSFVGGEVANDTIGTMVWSDSDYPGYGRYLQVEVQPGAGEWTMLAELIVVNGDVPAEYLTEPGTATTAEAVEVSVGKAYSLQPAPSEAYDDPDNTKVTDGSYDYAWADMIGFDTPALNPTVVIDLGERVEGITRVAGLFMRSFISGANFPKSLIVSVSDDGESFEVVGLATHTVPDPYLNEYVNSIYWQDLEQPVAARYVKVEIRPRGESWTMLAEVLVQTGAAQPEVEEPAEE